MQIFFNEQTVRITKYLPLIHFYSQNCVDRNMRYSNTSSGLTVNSAIHIEKNQITLLNRSKIPDKLTGRCCDTRQSLRYPVRIDRKASGTLRTLARILFTLTRVQSTKARVLFHQARVQFNIFSVLYTLDLGSCFTTGHLY